MQSRYFDTILKNTTVQSVLQCLIKNPKEDKILIVGGTVRDCINGGINRQPTDIDIATNLSVEEITERLKQVGRGKVLNNAVIYGSVSLFVDGYDFTITQFRQDVESFGRHARVQQTNNILEDAKRRDFTINAIYLNPFTGEIHDFFNGTKDLANGVVKFIGNPEDRIKEDYLRIMRYFRFLARISKGQMATDEDAIRAIKKLVTGLCKISKERITAELCKIAATPDPKVAEFILQQMDDVGVFSIIIGNKGGSILKHRPFPKTSNERVLLNTNLLWLFTCLSNDGREELLNALTLPKSFLRVLKSINVFNCLSNAESLGEDIKFLIASNMRKLDLMLPYIFLNNNIKNDLLHFISHFKPLPVDAAYVANLCSQKGVKLYGAQLGVVMSNAMRLWINVNFSVPKFNSQLKDAINI